MPDILDLLEQLGQDARLRHAPDSDILEACAQAGIDPGVATAVLAGDERTLARLLEAPGELCCLVFAPRRDDEEEEDEEPDDKQPDDGPKSQQRRVA